MNVYELDLMNKQKKKDSTGINCNGIKNTEMSNYWNNPNLFS